MNHTRVGRAIADGLAYIASAQQPDGSFLTALSYTQKPFREFAQVATTFTPALMLDALAKVSEAKDIRNSLAHWLVSEQSAQGSYNYWARSATEYSGQRYPDDLDDTFCTLIGLYRHNPQLVDGGRLAQAVQILVAAESRVGGPYYTWLVDKRAPGVWRDVDVAVNANIAYFLRLVGSSLPSLDALMEQAIVSGAYRSPYYCSPYMMWYYLARAYNGQHAKSMAQHIMRRCRDGHWGTPLQTALALSALANLHYPHKKTRSLHMLLESQQENGAWLAEALWVDRVHGQKKQYAGSAALTTALVIKVLSQQPADIPPSQGRRQLPVTNHYAQDVLRTAQQQMSELPQPLRGHIASGVRRIYSGSDRNEIMALPYLFAQHLHGDVSASPAMFSYLGAANAFGWLAYTIFDNFLDDEANTQLLPAATTALRLSLANFRQALPKHAAFHAVVEQDFNTIDAANSWEVAHCRFAATNTHLKIGVLPRYASVSNLASRSIGHELSPLGVLLHCGISVDDTRLTLFRRGFRHYLAARQLNDDLHDWQADVRKGHSSYVVAHLLRTAQVPAGTHSFATLLPKLEQLFWQTELVVLCKQVRRQTASARRAYRASGLLRPDNFLFRALDTLDATMERTLQEQQQASAFLAAYRQNK